MKQQPPGRRSRFARAMMGLALPLLGCGGTAGSDIESESAAPPEAAAATVPRLVLRHLTRRQYNGTVRDLLDDASRPADAFPAERVGENGYEIASSIGVSETEAYMTAAEALADAARNRLPSLLPCSPGAADEEDPCAERFIRTFARRAFRRPLDAEEVGDLMAVYRNARAKVALSFQDSIGAVLQAVLQAGSFLYHAEGAIEAPPTPAQDQVVRLTGHEMASRLSYYLTGTAPDEALLGAAAAGELTNSRGIERQARRLAEDSAALGESVTDFVRQWLELDTTSLEKSESAYPDFPALRPWLLGELSRSLGQVVASGGSVAALFTDPRVFVNETSAKIYGVAPGPDDDSPVAGNPAERAGIFTQLAFLSVHATVAGSHPIKRGKILLKNVLCGSLPPPPDNVPPARDPEPGLTTRQRFAEHAESPCATCHKLMDPYGFAFESYDGVGRYRTVEEGHPVDASGVALLPSGGELGFANAVDLLSQLAATPDVTACLAKNLARSGTGIAAGPDETVGKELLDLGGPERKLADLFAAVVRTAAFQFRRVAGGEAP